jgi:alpha/beta superfamily hydrolase
MKRTAAWVCLLALVAPPAWSQDYERERRWSDEIVPALVLGDAVWIEVQGGRKFLGIYSAQGQARASVLLVHGMGVHPDHGVIGALRAILADSGYATLSIQMPVLGADAAPKEYQPVFPEAVARIRAAADWLVATKAGRVLLLSHSMGSAMSGAYYEQTAGAPFAAWISIGLTGGFGRMRNVQVPVLDIYGEKDLPSVLQAAWRRRMTVDSIPRSRQVVIPQSDHFHVGHEKQLGAAIDAFIRDEVTR